MLIQWCILLSVQLGIDNEAMMMHFIMTCQKSDTSKPVTVANRTEIWSETWWSPDPWCSCVRVYFYSYILLSGNASEWLWSILHCDNTSLYSVDIISVYHLCLLCVILNSFFWVVSWSSKKICNRFCRFLKIFFVWSPQQLTTEKQLVNSERVKGCIDFILDLCEDISETNHSRQD